MDAIEFDYEKAKEMLDNAQVSTFDVLSKYNNIIQNKLTEKQRIIIHLYFCLKTYMTITDKTFNPKGNWWNERKDDYISHEEGRIFEAVSKIYLDIIDIFKKNRDKQILKEEVIKRTNNDINVKFDLDGKETSLIDIVNGFKNELKDAYIKSCPYAFTVTNADFDMLHASPSRENQYLNGIADSIFASCNLDGIEKYTARSQTGGGMMMDRNGGVHFPNNPFSGINENNQLMLNHPANVYISDASKYEPQFTFDYVDGKAQFIYGGEWVSYEKELECNKTKISYLPLSFIEKQCIYFEEERGKDTRITPELFDNMKL